MTEDARAVVEEMYVAFHAGDGERALSYFAEDVVVDARIRVDSGIVHGREAVMQIVGQWIAAFDEWHDEIEEIRSVGEHVWVVSLQTGRTRGAGVPIQHRYGLGYEVRGDQIVGMTFYPEAADALRAAEAAAAGGSVDPE